MKQLTTLILIACTYLSQAQENPFEELGYTPTIATLSGGKYVEYFDRDTIVQIGQFVYNTKSKKVIGFIEEDTMYSESTLQPDIVSRWLSPDPLEHQFTSYSPYNFTVNNPILFIDPDGKAIKPSNTSAAAVFRNIVTNYGGNDFFGIEVKGSGKSAYVTTNLSLKKFERQASKSLSGDDLSNAVAVFKVLKAQDIIEIAVVSATETQSNVTNTKNVQTNNSDVNQFMQNTDQSKGLSPLETKGEINNLLGNGDPSGEGFGFFPEENGSTVKNLTNKSIIPVEKPLGGILIVESEIKGDGTSNTSNSSKPRTNESTLQKGFNSIQDDVK